MKRELSLDGSDATSAALMKTTSAHQHLGVLSTMFLILNRIIGTGIFATPGTIFALSGSVGLSLMMWFVGGIVTAAGTAVYLEFGTGLPRSGGERNYLDFVYSRPRFLATSVFAVQAVVLGWAASNSVVFGEYMLAAFGKTVTRWNQRGIAFGCVSFAFLMHGLFRTTAVRLQNGLGAFKLLVILFIVCSGFAALAGHSRSPLPDNFSNAFEGTIGSAFGVVSSLYSVIWSYFGYSNANYALSEVRDPVRTLKIAAPLAVGLVSVLYMLVNVAYFAVVPASAILSSQRLIAAEFFGYMYGPAAERVLAAIVALSALGNVMAVIFSQGRVNQELGREGVLPMSKFWASNKPFNTPFAGLFLHWIFCVLLVLAPPPGDAYNFLLNLISFPYAIINLAVSGGLLYLYLQREKMAWDPPYRATLPVVSFFFICNIFLVVLPFVPPTGSTVYENLPYYLHCVVGFGILLLGAIYWAVWARLLPYFGRYKLIRRPVDDGDGMLRAQFLRVPLAEAVTPILADTKT